jgi:hypothetical protein
VLQRFRMAEFISDPSNRSDSFHLSNNYHVTGAVPGLETEHESNNDYVADTLALEDALVTALVTSAVQTTVPIHSIPTNGLLTFAEAFQASKELGYNPNGILGDNPNTILLMALQFLCSTKDETSRVMAFSLISATNVQVIAGLSTAPARAAGFASVRNDSQWRRCLEEALSFLSSNLTIDFMLRCMFLQETLNISSPLAYSDATIFEGKCASGGLTASDISSAPKSYTAVVQGIGNVFKSLYGNDVSTYTINSSQTCNRDARQCRLKTCANVITAEIADGETLVQMFDALFIQGCNVRSVAHFLAHSSTKMSIKSRLEAFSIRSGVGRPLYETVKSFFSPPFALTSLHFSFMSSRIKDCKAGSIGFCISKVAADFVEQLQMFNADDFERVLISAQEKEKRISYAQSLPLDALFSLYKEPGAVIPFSDYPVEVSNGGDVWLSFMYKMGYRFCRSDFYNGNIYKAIKRTRTEIKDLEQGDNFLEQKNVKESYLDRLLVRRDAMIATGRKTLGEIRVRPLRSALSLSHSLVSSSILLLFSDEVEEVVNQSLSSLSETADTFGSSINGGRGGRLLSLANYRRLPLTSALSLVSSLVSSSILLLFSDEVEEVVNQSLSSLSETADTFGSSINGGKAAILLGSANARRLPLLSALSLSHSLVSSSILLLFSDEVEEVVNQSLSSLSETADTFGSSINGGRGGRLLSLANYRRLPLTSALSLVSSLVSSSILLLFSDEVEEVVNQSLSSLSETADTFGSSINGGKAAILLGSANARRLPLLSALSLSHSLVSSSILLLFSDEVEEVVNQSLSSLSETADTFGSSINGGRGGRLLSLANYRRLPLTSALSLVSSLVSSSILLLFSDEVEEVVNQSLSSLSETADTFGSSINGGKAAILLGSANARRLPLLSALSLSHSLVSSSILLLFSDEVEEVVNQSLSSLSETADTFGSSINGGKAAILLGSANARRLPLLSALSLSHSLVSSSILLLFSDEVEEVVNQSLSSFSETADTFGSSINGGKAAILLGSANARRLPLLSALSLSHSLVSSSLLLFSDEVEEVVNQSLSSLPETADLFRKTVQGGRGAKAISSSEKVYAATLLLNAEALRLIPPLPPAVNLQDQVGLSWDEVSIARVMFCMKFRPQLPFLAIARFVYKDGGESTVRRIKKYQYDLQKKSSLGVPPKDKKRKRIKNRVRKEKDDDDDDDEKEEDDKEKDYDNEKDDDDKEEKEEEEEEVQLTDSRKRRKAHVNYAKLDNIGRR